MTQRNYGSAVDPGLVMPEVGKGRMNWESSRLQSGYDVIVFSTYPVSDIRSRIAPLRSRPEGQVVPVESGRFSFHWR